MIVFVLQTWVSGGGLGRAGRRHNFPENEMSKKFEMVVRSARDTPDQTEEYLDKHGTHF